MPLIFIHYREPDLIHSVDRGERIDIQYNNDNHPSPAFDVNKEQKQIKGLPEIDLVYENTKKGFLPKKLLD
jgi:hypothetical protein